MQTSPRYTTEQIFWLSHEELYIQNNVDFGCFTLINILLKVLYRIKLENIFDILKISHLML